MSLLNKLTKFYKDEKAKLPHEKAEIWGLAWALAEIMEDYGEGSNVWKGSSLYKFDEFVNLLKTKPDVVLIDIAIDMMHQTLLNSQNDDSENLLFTYLGQDIVQYLLTRNDDSAWQEAESWADEEDAKLAEIDVLDEEFWRKMDDLEGY